MSSSTLHIERTETSPQVDIDLKHGVLEFIGRSLPANSEAFYTRVHHWLDDYLRAPQPSTVVNMKMDYLDTSSSKHIYNILERLNGASERGLQVNVNWHFEAGDDGMEETGKDYQSCFRMDFNLVEVEELF
ncbi:MAG: DUF1987 domain-containing protein [Flavobacteriales bacterium]|nr:MAG: DUF1987 domain-containing protein [Flavobacteriales bacterium]